MNSVASDFDPFDEVAESFVDRYRRGERPSLQEYIDRYPELAGRIRELFPALVMVEQVGSLGDGRAASPAETLLSKGHHPEALGEYRILREVGRGGMGIVYEAVQESLGRHVALKVMPFHTALAPTHLERFRREAQSAAHLHHTNIVPVFGVGEHEGVHYYAMQFIQGQGLDTVLQELRALRRSHGRAPIGNEQPPASGLARSVAGGLLTGQFCGPDKPADPGGATAVADLQPAEQQRHVKNVPPPSGASGAGLVVAGDHSELTTQTETQYFHSVARVGVQVADALAYAHEQGIIHRDIKPPNLLLDTHGTIWVTDFGLAKGVDANELTGPGDIVGTLRYMAPERFLGVTDVRGDVYSLGATLYEMATLRAPFDDNHRLGLIRRIAHEEPAAPRKVDRRIPPDLETIILKALEKDPERRFQSAAAMADELRLFLADRTLRIRRSSWRERCRRWCRRNPAVASLLLIASLLVVTVTVVATVSALVYKSKSDEAEEERQHAQQAERLARLREAEALVGQAHWFRLSRRPGQRFDALAALDKAAAIGRELGQPARWFDQLRNEAIAALALPDLHITKEFGSFPQGSVWVDVSDDFELYALITDKGSCTIRRVADDTQVAHLPELGEPAYAEFGTGRILAVHGRSSKRFQLWDVSGDKPVLRFEESGITSWGFHPKGHLAAVGHDDGPICVYDTATGMRLHRWPAKEVVEGLLLFHPTSPLLATAHYFSRNVWVYDLGTGAVVASAVTPGRNGTAAWSPDGRTLTVPPGDAGKIQQYAFDTEAPALRLMRALDYTESGVAISYNPGADRFVDFGWSGKVNLFDAVSGQVLFSTVALPAGSHRLRFDRTGQRLAAARVGDRSDRIGIWSVADAREYVSLRHAGTHEASWGRGLVIHPKHRLAATTLTHGVALLDLDSGRVLAQLPSSGGCGLCFDGAGNLLTNSFAGFFRWQVRPDPANPGCLLVGPPERLPFQAGNRIVSASRDGRVIAQSMWNGYGMSGGGWIMHPAFPTPRQVQATESTGTCSVSPDGHWVAFSGSPDTLTVYDAASAERAWQLRGRLGTGCRFSPDGRWIATDTDGGRLYAVGTWKPGPRLGPGTPWDMTKKLAVLGLPSGIYRLVELSTGRELARLEDPDRNTGPAAFTPDGTKLVIAAKDSLRVWDLRRIRGELAKLDLDWDAPPFPPPAATSVPLTVEVNLGELARPSLTAQEKARRAIEHHRRALQAKPDDPSACNSLAWAYLTAPEPLRDVKTGLALAQKAIRHEPNNPVFGNTLGLAYYRLGRYPEAVAVLRRNLSGQQDWALAYDLYFLAMCYQRLGEPERARDYFACAVRWSQAQKGLAPQLLDELSNFRAEAEAVLGIATTPTPPDQQASPKPK
jgi:serine/threonine protein kinase/WD40 repeat protein